MVTAKVKVVGKSTVGEGEDRQCRLDFAPDYADGRNKEWALATPNLSLNMIVKGDVADCFEYGGHYTLQFVEESVEEDEQL